MHLLEKSLAIFCSYKPWESLKFGTTAKNCQTLAFARNESHLVLCKEFQFYNFVTLMSKDKTTFVSMILLILDFNYTCRYVVHFLLVYSYTFLAIYP